MRKVKYSIHGLCACAALSIAAAFASGDAGAAPLPIVAKHSGKCLDITGGPGATAPGVAAEQWECTGATNQSFTLQSDGAGRFQIIPQHSGLCLGAANGNENAPVFQTTCNVTDIKQLWAKQTAGASTEFTFKQVSGGRCLAVAGGTGATGNGPAIQLQACPTPAANQIWTIGRNPLYWPFTQSSIWNTPIGSGAQYVAAGLPAIPDDPNDHFPNNGPPIDSGWSPMPQIDEERIVLVPTAPQVTIQYSSGGWSGNRCTTSTLPNPNFTGLPVANVPIPASYLLDDPDPKNDGAAFLMSDGETLVQTEPWARCTSGGPATSIIRILDDGTNNNTNSGSDGNIKTGNGRKGAHGGSMLGTLGGTIRLGEMRPGSGQGPHHALKINLFSKMELFNCSVVADCFRWPAYTADSGATTNYGSINNNTNSAMKMGALLAIPPSVNINNIGLLSEPGRQIAWTLQNYGAYVVDSMGAGMGISAESGYHGSKLDEFAADYPGLSMKARVGHGENSDWSHDLQIIRPLLQVVNNNSATSVGGGGTPRQPLAPPLQ